MRKLVSYIIFCKRISPDLHAKPGCSRLSHSTNQVDFLEVRSIKRERKLLEAGFLTAVRRCQLARKGEKKNWEPDWKFDKSRSPVLVGLLNGGTDNTQAIQAFRASAVLELGTNWRSTIPRQQQVLAFVTCSVDCFQSWRDIIHFGNGWTRLVISWALDFPSMKQG